MSPETERHLIEHRNAIQKLQDAIGQAARERQEKEREATAEKMLEALTKLVSVTYDKNMAYTNLIMIGGYASFFALWAATKPVLHDLITIASALLMLLSVSTFVLFEVFRMALTSHQIYRNKHLLDDPKARADPVLINERLKEFDSLQRKETLRFFRIWVCVIGVAVPTAVIALALLAGNYFYVLISGIVIRLF